MEGSYHYRSNFPSCYHAARKLELVDLLPQQNMKQAQMSLGSILLVLWEDTRHVLPAFCSIIYLPSLSADQFQVRTHVAILPERNLPNCTQTFRTSSALPIMHVLDHDSRSAYKFPRSSHRCSFPHTRLLQALVSPYIRVVKPFHLSSNWEVSQSPLRVRKRSSGMCAIFRPSRVQPDLQSQSAAPARA